MAQSKTTSLIPVRRGQCLACVHTDHAQVLEDLDKGFINNKEAANRIGIALQTWYTHLRHHVKPEVESAIAPNVDVLAKSIVDKVEEGTGQFDRLLANVNRVNNLIDQDGDNLDVKKMQSYIQLEKQLTYVLEFLSKLSGELENSAIINVNNTKIEFNNFKDTVKEVLCLSCKEKIIKLETNEG